MAGFLCPFCQHNIAVNNATHSSFLVNRQGFIHPGFTGQRTIHPEECYIEFYICPNCEQTTIKFNGKGSAVKGLHVNLFPQSAAQKYPDYIPASIRSDYEEACAIVNLSPKASATLSRRCIQGMIRDFWQIRKSRLVDEIDALDELIPATQKKALHALRRVGNIGAHPDASVNEILDIEPADASKLIALIEFFMNSWYVERNAQEQLLNNVIALIDD